MAKPKTVRNQNRVPRAQWRKWTNAARRVFNDTYAFMMKNPDLITHPAMPKPKPFHWTTLAWNAAWIAADALNGELPTEVITVNRRGVEIARAKVAA